MELSKEQLKHLLDAINWEINQPCYHLNIEKLKICLDKACIDYEE